MNFTISNSKNEQTSEVAQEYVISVNTTKNLPLMYKLVKNDTIILKETSESFLTDIQELPLNKKTEDYKLIISWPEDVSVSVKPKSEDYSLDIDYIKIDVKATQKD